MELSKKNDDHLLELRVAKMFRQTQMGCLDPLVPTAHHFRASFLGSCHLLNGRPDRMRCFRCFWLHFSVFNGQLTTTMAPWFRYQQRPRFIRNVLLWGDPETAKGDMAPELLELQKQAQARYQASPNGSCLWQCTACFRSMMPMCLVGGLEHFFSIIDEIILPIDTYFSEGFKPPTRCIGVLYVCIRI